MQYFPLFITWIMLCVIIYPVISHHMSREVCWIHFQCLYTGISLFSQSRRVHPRARVARSNITCGNAVSQDTLRVILSEQETGNAYLQDRYMKNWCGLLLLEWESTLFKRRQQTCKGVSTALTHQIRPYTSRHPRMPVTAHLQRPRVQQAQPFCLRLQRKAGY